MISNWHFNVLLRVEGIKTFRLSKEIGYLVNEKEEKKRYVAFQKFVTSNRYFQTRASASRRGRKNTNVSFSRIDGIFIKREGRRKIRCLSDAA